MRFFKVLALTLVASLLLSACGAATAPTVSEQTDDGQRFLISLPRMVVDIDDAGQASIGGLSVDAVNNLMPGMQLPDLAVNPFYVDWMRNTNIQHLELVSGDDGVFVFINGEPLPYLGWDGEALSNLAIVTGLTGLPYGQLITKLVPIVQRTGLDFAVKFPMQAGATEIPLRDPSVPVEAPEMAEEQPATFITRIDVKYDENGVPTMAGISSRDLAEAAGLYLPVELTPETLAQIKAAGVNEMRLVTGNNGVFVTVNGQPLPHIAWNDAILGNTADMYGQINPDSPYIALAKLFLPELDNLDIDLRLLFPQ
ncbi:MAG: hypothetical protein KDI03_07975 [Anaerolineae bacterium]|nr:hypothetical protein [Anaerolineae bacterium]MCB0199994.1 hypothetical protein [Anaerolineae bacterium]MCB0204329.1 hypothetical protein [Anaerolineae bacterium]